MRVLGSSVAAMDAHRGVAAVAERGLGFLKSLAVAADNMVGGEGGPEVWVRWEDVGWLWEKNTLGWAVLLHVFVRWCREVVAVVNGNM